MSQWFANKSLVSERAGIFSSVSLIIVLVLLFILISDSVHSETTVYAWQDVSGAIAFSDDPVNAPSDAQVKILLQASESQTVSETRPTRIVAPQLPEIYSRVVMQGEFAVRLVEELGLADQPTEEDAVDSLVSARITPKLGLWELDQPMSPELTVRLRKLTVAAAERGWITLSPEQGLLAFDTAAALMGLTIPVTTDREEASDAPYPIAETPPVVYVAAPPPDIYTYYVWTPVAGGFWWHDYLFPGFYVLNVNLFFSNRHGIVFRDQPVALDSGRIGRQFRSRIIDHHVKRSPVTPNTGRTARSAFRPGSGPESDRKVSLPTSRDPGLHRPGSDPSRMQQKRRQDSLRPTVINPSIHRQSSSPRPDSQTPTVKSSPPRPTEPTPRVRSSPPRSLPDRNVEASAAVTNLTPPSTGQRFSARPSQEGFENVAGRGQSGR